MTPLRLAYADPPYPGKAELYRDHPDYAGEVDQVDLIARLRKEYDGWALSTSAAALRDLLPLCPPDVRVLAWVKNTINVSWEPVIVKRARIRHLQVRDWIHVEADSYQWRAQPDSYVIGQKPGPFCAWIFHWLGALAGDSFDDLFPGSGAVGRAWELWSAHPMLPLEPSAAAKGRAERRATERSLAEHPVIFSETS